QKDRSRSAAESQTEDWVVLRPNSEEKFIGYDTLESRVKIAKYRKITDKKRGSFFQLVFDQTPFYAESGGQVGDQGVLIAENEPSITIFDTKKENNLIVHFIERLPKDPAASLIAK